MPVAGVLGVIVFEGDFEVRGPRGGRGNGGAGAGEVEVEWCVIIVVVVVRVGWFDVGS